MATITNLKLRKIRKQKKYSKSLKKLYRVIIINSVKLESWFNALNPLLASALIVAFLYSQLFLLVAFCHLFGGKN
jgi:transcriptional/translational regulatory protein YebC/TACO1